MERLHTDCDWPMPAISVEWKQDKGYIPNCHTIFFICSNCFLPVRVTVKLNPNPETLGSETAEI